MKKCFFLFCCLISIQALADNLANYMDIENKIPSMQMKTDIKSHAWARSAKKILVLHDEAISECINEMNEFAKANGKPLFCLPNDKALTPEQMHLLILKAARGISDEEKKHMSVAKAAIIALKQKYACVNHFNQANDASFGQDEEDGSHLPNRASFDESRARMLSVREND